MFLDVVNVRAMTLSWLTDVDGVLSDNLEAPQCVLCLCPAQLRPGGLQVL